MVLDLLPFIKRREVISHVFASSPGRNDVYRPIVASVNNIIKSFTNEVSCGDSIAAGSNASPTSNCYTSLLGSKFGITPTNCGVSGQGYYGTWVAVKGQGFTRNKTIFIDETGLNDIRRGASNPRTILKMQTSIDAMMVKLTTFSSIASGNAGVVRTGTFFGYNTSSQGGNFVGSAPPGNVGTYSSTQGDTWSYTFTGYRGIAVSFIGTDGTDATVGGIAEVRIDGALIDVVDLTKFWDGISDGTNDNKHGIVYRPYYNLNEFQTHTIEVKVATVGKRIPVDGFFLLQTPEQISPAFVFVMDIPLILQINESGYNNTDNSLTWNCDYANKKRLEVYNKWKRWGFNIINVNPNKIYQLFNCDPADFIHPNNAGHYEIFKSLVNDLPLN